MGDFLEALEWEKHGRVRSCVPARFFAAHWRAGRSSEPLQEIVEIHAGAASVNAAHRPVKGAEKTEADVVVRVRRVVVVAISAWQVGRVVVPAAAPQDTVGAA